MEKIPKMKWSKKRALRERNMTWIDSGQETS